MTELTIWWVVRLLLIGILIGAVMMDVLIIKPAMEGWESCIDGWESAHSVLRQCVATCNFSVCDSEPSIDIGEVMKI